ncbi:MAG TPA: carbonic anhydrase [Candidatus Baltobacteraceae bacterium]|nr:carbonic anhydrase [Candidatus Baltobacteraceae bacterium]
MPSDSLAANADPPMSAAAALKNLMAGNTRFSSDQPIPRRFMNRVRQIASGQSPFATVLGCADSRVPVETIFDHEPGDIFTVRLAGNFITDAILGSIEYAVAVLKSPLIMVLGHTSCGAVKAAVDFVKTGKPLPGHMQSLAAAIEPAAKAVQHNPGDWLHNAVVENVRLNAQQLRSSTPILAEAVRTNTVDVVGAVYDLGSGKVTVV